MSDFPYPEFTDQQKIWFNTVLEGMVSNPEQLNWARVKGQRDLEIMIIPAPEDGKIFTEEVCLALQALVAAVTGVFRPVIYLQERPHAQAARSHWNDQYFI